MSWTVLPYLLATGGAVVDTDMSAVADAEFSRRNNHYILTEDYNLGAAVAMGATITRARLNVPTFNAITLFNIWPVMLSSAKVLSPPRVAWLWPNPPRLPQNEELAIAVTDGASENAMAFLFPFTPGHTRNVPPNVALIPARFTAAVTQAANAWSAPVVLSMEQSLRGGTYSIVGCEVVCVNSALFRLIFPRSRLYKGRRLRPGFLCTDVIGDQPDLRMHLDPMYMGEWGRFHSFELPQIEVYGAAAAAGVTVEGRVWLAYLGESESPLDQWVSMGGV